MQNYGHKHPCFIPFIIYCTYMYRDGYSAKSEKEKFLDFLQDQPNSMRYADSTNEPPPGPALIDFEIKTKIASCCLDETPGERHL